MAAERVVERRIVSILFADLVGFTSLSERLDPEDSAAIQAAYFATVRATITRYGGELEKFIGDAVMAVFGIPRTREDDAERAVRAGLALAAAVGHLAARVGLESDTLELRVGVNTGEVVHAPDATPAEAMVSGDPVNVAARLQSAAAPGEVLASESTVLAAAATIEFAEPRALELKGKAEPVLARRAVAGRAEPSRDAAMGSLRAPLLGRDDWLARLSAEIELAATEPRQLLIVAAPGVGKSRLVDEIASKPHGAAVARARLRPDVIAPYEPVAQLFSMAGAAEEPVLRARLQAAGVAPARVQVLVEEAFAVLRPKGHAAVGSERESRFWAWLEALDALAGERIGLWIVEDAHWAGPDLLAFLAFAGGAPGRRLVVTTARPSLLESAADWCAAVGSFELEALDRPAAAELVRALVGEALPAGLVTRITERSDGNPLFIEELLRTWISVALLVEDDGTWTLTRSIDDVLLPPTVQALYAAQLDDLPGSARQVARLASVAGRRFPVAALGALDDADLASGVDLLARRALVSDPFADPIFGPSRAYRHALLRDAAYASLARSERARLHVRFAAWLEGVEDASPAHVAEPIARHYARALESAPALAREVAPLLDREECRQLAAAWFERAAGAALELAATDTGRDLLGRALAFTAAEETENRARRLTTLGEVTASSADLAEAVGLLEQALEIARAAGDRSGLARAAAALSWVLDEQLEFAAAIRVTDEALEQVGDAHDLETGLLLIRRASATNNASDAVSGPLADAERALAIATALGDVQLELEALQLLVPLRGGDAEAQRALEERALECGAWEAAATAMQARALSLAPDHAWDARPIVERAIELGESRGLRESLAWSHHAAVEIDFVSGHWDAAIDSAERALEIGEQGKYDRAVVRTWATALPIAAARHDDAMVERSVWLAERFRAAESLSPYALILTAGVRLHVAARGFHEPFVPDVEERLASFELPYVSPSWLAALEAVVEAWLAAGELDGSRRALGHLQRARVRLGGESLHSGTHALLHGRWLLASGEDPGESARGALACFRESRAPWWIAKALRLLSTPEAIAEAATVERTLGIPA